jgi:hypothetical protein
MLREKYISEKKTMLRHGQQNSQQGLGKVMDGIHTMILRAVLC